MPPHRFSPQGLASCGFDVRQRSSLSVLRPPTAGLVGSLLVCVACFPAPVVDNDGTSSTGADSTSTTTTSEGSTGTGPLPQAPECVTYLACLAETADDDAIAAAEALYGEQATCWLAANTAAGCASECSMLADEQCSGSSGSETGEPLPRCAIEALVPGTPNPIVAGTDVGQLPLDIGDLLARNCGCHYVDDAALAPEVPAYLGAMQLATWQDFHSPFNGVAVRDRVAERAIVQLSMPPVFYCDSLAFGSLSAEDHALLDQWLAAGAPDGASWP